jgi:hypothetical protein
MENAVVARAEIGRRGKALYEQSIREKVETEENIGKMVIVEVETGDFEIDELGIESARRLRERHPDAHLFGMRIGYNVAESFGGVIERTGPK